MDTRPRLARWLLCLGACVVGVVVLLLTSQSDPAGAAFPGPNGRIVFTSGDDLYSMRSDGSGRDNLTETAGVDDDEGTLSADGTKIAFVTRQGADLEIYTMNADGSNQVNRTNHAADHDTAPTWSPDGTKIAFVRDHRIWVMNANGSGQAALPVPGSVTDDQPAWSPDGTKIAFSRSGGFTVNPGIHVMDADGTDAVNVDGGTNGVKPSWSPDGTKIAFADGAGTDIYVTNANGSGSPTPLGTGSGGADFPAWSPDGAKIAFESSRGGYWDIYTINVDGTGLDNVTDTALEVDDNRPDWGRDTVAPTVTITTPPDGASYALGQAVAADYACSDASTGVATCTGPVADGAALDTATAGAKTFTATGTDKGGNSRSITHAYTVRSATTVPDTEAPTLTVRAKRRQKAGRKIRVKVTSDEAALAVVGGKIVVKPPKSTASTALKRTRRFKLKSMRSTLLAGETTLFKLRPKGTRRKSRRTLRKIRRLVLDGNRARARVKLSATDASGNESKVRRKIKLVR